MPISRSWLNGHSTNGQSMVNQWSINDQSTYSRSQLSGATIIITMENFRMKTRQLKLKIRKGQDWWYLTCHVV